MYVCHFSSVVARKVFPEGPSRHAEWPLIGGLGEGGEGGSVFGGPDTYGTEYNAVTPDIPYIRIRRYAVN